MKMIISKGKAHLAEEGLRCSGPRISDPKIFCNKLLAKYNKQGLISGSFKCERCDQKIDVDLVL